jgi:Fe-S cluster biogenesis protein NfuA
MEYLLSRLGPRLFKDSQDHRYVEVEVDSGYFDISGGCRSCLWIILT